MNATGAWAHDLPHSSVRLRLTKGVHLVIHRERLPVDGAVVLSEKKRILFAIPWGERLILGTTDTDYSGDPAAVRTEMPDIDYILGVVNRGFPGARLRPHDVIATWAGVRPLIAPRRPAAGTPSDVSRRHEIRMPKPGWFDITGGKLTTYRLMAEQAVDRIVAHLGLAARPSTTAATPLAGEPADVRFSGILPPPIEEEVVRHCCRHEWARRLADVLVRRTSWHYWHPAQDEIARRVSLWMARELGWSERRRLQEIEDYRNSTLKGVHV